MISIEKMTEGHLDAVEGIERASFASPWSRDMFAAELRHDFSRCLVAMDGSTGELCGYIVFWVTVDEVQLHDVAVAPDRRGLGLGRRLMEAMLAEGMATGAERAFLEVRVSNLPALALYHRLGFVEVGRRRGYYASNGEDAIVMGRAMTPAEAPPLEEAS